MELNLLDRFCARILFNGSQSPVCGRNYRESIHTHTHTLSLPLRQPLTFSHSQPFTIQQIIQRTLSNLYSSTPLNQSSSRKTHPDTSPRVNKNPQKTKKHTRESQKTMQPFHLTATGFNLNYLPEYIALRHGFFLDQGLDISVKIPTPWDGVLDELATNRAEVALGGAWVPSMYRDRVQNYTILGQIANRCPLAIIRRTTSTAFNLSDIIGRTVLMKSIGGASVGLFFKMLLRENGVDPRQVDYIQDLDGVMLGNLFQGGMGDYFITDNLSARTMAARNPDVSIALECVTQGEVPWSVYYQETAKITPEALAVQERFFLGLQKGINWVLANDAESFREELAELFPAAPIDVVVGLTNSFRREGMWKSVVVPPVAFNRWQQGLTDARLVKEPLTYESMVNDAAAVAAANKLRTNGLMDKKALTNGKSTSNGTNHAVQPPTPVSI